MFVLICLAAIKECNAVGPRSIKKNKQPLYGHRKRYVKVLFIATNNTKCTEAHLRHARKKNISFPQDKRD